MTRMLLAFGLGLVLGFALWAFESQGLFKSKEFLQDYVSPFGLVFIQMLKMVVVPIVFCSLLQGAASLPLSKFGRIGGRLFFLYILSSFVASFVGIGFALLFNPGAEGTAKWQQFLEPSQSQALTSQAAASGSGIKNLILSMFDNPFNALANGNFLALIVFSIGFGLALSALNDRESTGGAGPSKGHASLLSLLETINQALAKLVTWIMEYAPIGILALSTVNFAIYGPAIVGPYLRVVGGIILGILFMIFVVYSLVIRFICKASPFFFFSMSKEAMFTAFATRSSAAALPISLKVAKKLDIDDDVASFALPMGATVNMDGVCVHLPMFAVLAANIFQIPLGAYELFLLTISTVFAAVGTGGIPGGSLMLLFIVLGGLGLPEESIAVVISLALGVNPILDMFETSNNVTGDLTCAFIVGRKERSLS